MHIFISAGEPSGDLHGANLVKALKRIDPAVKCVGFGGDKMAAAGCELLYPLTKLAVMWFFRALLNIVTFWRILKQAQRYFREQRPDAVIVIDMPGFHWPLAKRAHALGIPVYYFVPPQLWAWAGWRVKKMKRYVRHVLAALPFEDAWYRERSMPTTYIGHPYFDELAEQELDQSFLEQQRQRPGKVVAILPGSRKQEVAKNIPEMLQAAAIIHQRHPKTRFLVASYNEAQGEMARKAIVRMKLPVEVHVGRTPEIIELAEACIAVSGSVSLEIMYRLKPAAVVYRLGYISLRVGRYFMKCKYITLVNLLADREIFPEFLTDRNPSEMMAQRILEWLDDPSKIEATRAALRAVKDRVAQPGACDRAAAFIVEQIEQESKDRELAIQAA
jgi:lipid-A-disaccharide synthase